MAPTHVTPATEQPTCALKQEQMKLPAFRITKSGVKRNTKKLPKALQRPIPPSGKIYPVKVRADGLLNIEDVPDYLMAAVKRNSTQSPLLRIDKQIRMKIWDFAMGGHTIEIRARKPGCSTLSVPLSSGSPFVGKVAHHGPKRAQPKTAFHLAEVCRQVYAETATLGYATNQFAFVGEVEVKSGREDGPDGALEGWCKELLPAQRNAVTNIRPHWHDLQDFLSDCNLRTFKQLFPELKSLRVPSRAVNCEAKWPHRGDPMRRHLRQQAKEKIAAMIRRQEGKDVQAAF
ncbi:beta transducin [Kalmusia sp. IMI 367209]|nr:beta transducin [Kalmusia sp. IMI 367209]